MKKTSTKLALNKQTITRLNNDGMDMVKGGILMTICESICKELCRETIFQKDVTLQFI